ncbi:hypothetical protein [Kribbella caucasensis]|nr:hypothetical protein [Kribbella sp. VKM Ac-2527]
MIELVSSLGSAVLNSAAGKAMKPLALLLDWLVFCWLAAALHHRQLPSAVLQHAIDWTGLSWSIGSATEWLHTRSDAVATAAVVLAFVAIAGVALGSVTWFETTRGPVGLALAVLMLLEVDGVSWQLILLGCIGPVIAMVRERSLESGLFVLTCPLLYLLLPPLTIIAQALGFSRPRAKLTPRAESRAQPASLTTT